MSHVSDKLLRYDNSILRVVIFYFILLTMNHTHLICDIVLKCSSYISLNPHYYQNLLKYPMSHISDKLLRYDNSTLIVVIFYFILLTMNQPHLIYDIVIKFASYVSLNPHY